MLQASPTASLEAFSTAWARVVDDTIVRGEGACLHAASGKQYLDFTSGIGVTNTGHCHPAVVAAVREQAEKLLFGQMNCVVPETAVELAETLTPIMPEGLDGYFFSNSGAEAVEGAVKLARVVTGKPNIIAFQGGFHGRSAMTMALTSSKTVYRAGYQPLPGGVFFSPFPYTLRYGWDEEQTVDFCLRELEHVLASQTAPSETAAMLLEPVLGEGGYVQAPMRFIAGLREVCDRHGILLIVDEIQSGFGRTGRWWAHSPSGARPDILTLAKGIASGLPMSVIAAPREMMHRWPPGTHGGTYGGGSAIAQAAAVATIRAIQDEGMIDNARERGEQLTARLKEVADRHDCLREIRGPGLMVGCEFTAGAEGKKIAGAVSKHCAEAGLLLLTCGTDGNVVRFIPPLIVTAEQIDHAADLFADAVAAAAK
ncbi:MAG: aminotransferase class III-fold pyridoxal phosphate-dependent enzyme [Planctomycetota bacterium]